MPSDTDSPPLADDTRFGFSSRRDGDLFVFEIEFTSNLRLVRIVRRFVGDYFGELFQDAETISRLAMATHELMENAMKYAAGTCARLAIRYRPSTGEVTVRSTNQATLENAKHVTALIDELAKSGDPMSVYVTLMRATAQRESGSGLGLARIWVEGEMTLGHDYSDGALHITATAATLRRTELQ